MYADLFKTRLRPLMQRTPWIKRSLEQLRALRFALHTPASVFDRIHRHNFWKAVEARSRTAGGVAENGHFRLLLQAVIEKYDIQTLLDLPCGDFHWMSETNLNGCTYIGGDIVPDIVRANEDRFASQSIMFRKIDILKDRLPKAELLLCRDLFVHLSTAHIRRALTNIKRSDIRFLMMTQFERAGSYENIVTGAWRPINFRLPPFGFPAPLEIISERVADFGEQQRSHALGKSLALWRVCDLPG